MLRNTPEIIMIGGQRACVRVILVLREFIGNVSVGSLVLPALDDALGSPPRRVVYPPTSIQGDFLPFPCEE